MSYPTGYNAKGLAPQIIILDQNGDEQYRFEHHQISNNPTQDFKLVSWHIRAGINSEHGSSTLILLDHDSKLIDTSDKKRRLKIKNGWQVKIYLGKDSTGLQIWHHGIIEEPAIHRPQNKLQYLSITSFGYGIRLAQRFGNITRYQNKIDDGLTLDNTDDTAKVSEIVKDIIQDEFTLVSKGSGVESITVNGVDDIDLKLPDFVRRFNSLGLMLNELSQIAGAVYGVGPDRDLFFRIRGSKNSGFLISNDVVDSDNLTKLWNQDKIFFTRNQNFTFMESTIGSGYTTVIGIGAQHEELDLDESDSNASANLSSKYYAIPFTPTKSNISKVALFLSKTGNPINHLTVKIIGALDDGAPNVDDVKQTDIVPRSRLRSELETARFLEISFSSDVLQTDGEKLFLLVEKYEDNINYLTMDYQTGTGNYYDSTNGTTWTERTGRVKMRTYHSQTVHILGQNTVLRKKSLSKESTYPLKDFPNEDSAIISFEGILSVLGRIHRGYSPIVVSAPTSRPDIGTTIRLIDKFNGLDTDVEIVGYDITASIENDNLSAVNMSIDVEEWL